MGFQPLGKLKGIFFKRSKSTLTLPGKDVEFSYNGSIVPETCSECNEVYNMGKKRKLIDVCGHHRCFTCITQNDNCRICSQQQDSGTPTKKSSLRQKYFPSEVISRTTNNSPVPIQRPLSANKNNGIYSYGKCKVGTPAVVSSLHGIPRLLGLTSSSPRGRISSISQHHHQQQYQQQQQQLQQQENDNISLQKTPRSSSGRRSVLSTISRIQENGIHSSPLSEHDEGFEDIRKFKSFGGGSSSNSSGAYNRIERYLSKRILQGQNPGSRLTMGRGGSQLHTSCSSLASSTASDHTNTLLSTSRASYDTSSLVHHRITEISVTPSSGLSLAAKSPVHSGRQQLLSYPQQRAPIRYSSCVRQEQLPLKPLFFEVPMQEEDAIFIGRRWLFEQMEEILFTSELNSNSRGIIISGKHGSGKTSILLQLVEHSCFGRRRNLDLDLRYAAAASSSGRASSLLYEDELQCYPESIRSMASHVVAYQFCQVENNISCLVPEFLHSIAAQLCQAPQLSAYREYLFEMPSCQKYLSKMECLRNPTEALMKGILEPLNYLYKINKISSDFLIIVIDGVCEAEFHRSDSGDTIASFLSKNILKFPCWLKVIISIRSQHQSIVSLIPFYRIKLDENDASVAQDLFDYITYRVKKGGGSFLRKTISSSSSSGGGSGCGGSKNDAAQFAFIKRLIKLSAGNYLYAKLTLDMIEDNHLQIKSSDFKELPKSSSEVFLKLCNGLFPTDQSFLNAAPIFSVCLAALNPLTLLEIYHSVNCLNATERLTWENFIEIFKGCSRLLLKRSDGTHMMLHPSFRDWLLQREDAETKKFFCDLRIGHAAIAFRFSRIEAPLNEAKTLELGHHILKAHIYKNMPISRTHAGGPPACPPRDLQALWLANCSQDLSLALASPANIYYPNVKVSRLLLLAGANPNEVTQWRNAPLLSVCSGEGLEEMVSLLLEFGADINGVDEDGNSALHTAAENGQLEIVRFLVQQGATISQVNHDEESALVKAAVHNRLTVVAFLLNQTWEIVPENGYDDYDDEEKETDALNNSTKKRRDTGTGAGNGKGNSGIGLTVTEASQHALVAASAYGHVEIVQHIIEEMNAPVNCPDTLYGENPLCAACANGREAVVQLLLQHGASINAVNLRDSPPLILAANGGHSVIVKTLLEEGAPVNRTDLNKRTALIVAAKEGHLDVVDTILAFNGGGGSGGAVAVADVNLEDKDGLTALSWAALRGHAAIVQSLLSSSLANGGGGGGGEEIDVNHADMSGRSPLDLASYCGSEEITQLLLDRGAVLEHVDLQGVRPLDRAVGCGHREVVQLFLKRGAKLGPNTWTMATGKPHIILALLNKLLEDGNVLYRKGQLKDAMYRYQYAVRKIPVNEYDEDMQATFDEMKMTFQLQLSRCKRKMNEEDQAIQLATEVIKMQPNSVKAYQVRAKAYQATKEITEAVNDVNRAMELVGHNSELPLRRQLFRLKEELTRESRNETRNTSPRFVNPSLNPTTTNTNNTTTSTASYLKQRATPNSFQTPVD